MNVVHLQQTGVVQHLYDFPYGCQFLLRDVQPERETRQQLYPNV